MSCRAGRIEAVQVGDGVGDAEGGLEIEMQGAVAKRGQIHQRGAVVNRLQSQGEIDGDGGRAAATFGVHIVNTLPREFSRPGLRRVEVRRTKASSRSVVVVGALDVLSHTGPHGANNQLRLGHGADGEDGRFGNFLMNQFHGPQRGR